MDERHFWSIVEDACADRLATDDWSEELTERLVCYPAEDIVEWNHIFDRFAADAYRADLWAAAYLINGGASDDGFYYFRCWLIGMGRQIYTAAIANLDSLADVVESDWFVPHDWSAESETYAAAHRAWMRVTGNDYDAPYPARNERVELIGEFWNFDDPNLMRHHLPRLAALLDD